MSWKVNDIMKERTEFISRLESGERMSDLCREYEITRKTGYKFLKRYKEFGLDGLQNQSRTPRWLWWKTSEEIQSLILELKQKYSTWGANKLRVELVKRNPGLKFPVRSTIHRILDSHGYVKRRRRRKKVPLFQDKLTASTKPNDIWCADFKGQFLLGNRHYCYPLTISDHYSRFLNACEGLDSTTTRESIWVFEAAFRKHGMPEVIRTDNGTPFASRGLAGLSKLSVWWIRLGIRVERIEPGHPEQNGRHERMHLTLKEATTRPPGKNFLHQQERFDNFINEYNNIRPHEALGMKCPSEVYKSSLRSYPKTLPKAQYPLHDLVRIVTECGKIYLFKQKYIFLGTAFSGQEVGLREIEPYLWLISYMNLDLGYYDEKTAIFEPKLK